MVCVFFGEVFYTKFIYTEGRGGLVVFVNPQVWSIFHWFIPVGGEFGDKWIL